MDKTEELQATVETLIDLDEPEALLETLRRNAQARSAEAGTGKRWRVLAQVLGTAQVQLDLILNAKPARPPTQPGHETPDPPWRDGENAAKPEPA